MTNSRGESVDPVSAASVYAGSSRSRTTKRRKRLESLHRMLESWESEGGPLTARPYKRSLDDAGLQTNPGHGVRRDY